MSGNRKHADRTDSEAARARKRAAFIATLRRVSHASLPAPRPAKHAPAATQVIEAQVTRREVTRADEPQRQAPRPVAGAEAPPPKPATPAAPPSRAATAAAPKAAAPPSKAAMPVAEPAPKAAAPAAPPSRAATAAAPKAAAPASRVAMPVAQPAPRASMVAAMPPAAAPLARPHPAEESLPVARTHPPQPPAPRPDPAQPNVKLFREQALKHQLAAEEGRGLVRVSPPWTWALLWCVVLAVGAAIATAFVGEVEVTSRGRGVLRPAAGVRVLTTQMTGTVARIEARSGERVQAGDVLVRIESATAQAQLLEADRQLEAVRDQFSGVASQQDRHYAEQVDLLGARAKRVSDQIASLRASAAHQERRLAADQQLLSKGLVSEIAVGETRDALAQAQRQLNAAEQSLDQTRQELASLEARRQDELWQRQQLVSAAQTKRDSLAIALRESVVRAPEDGIVEALSARVGEVVQAGQPVGKIVPVQSPLVVVSFLAERDRAFAKAGDEVQLELDQLPHAEYGTLRAKVVRIGGDLASPQEIREAFGEEQKLGAPSYRVELEITDASAAEAAKVQLRTGTLMDVRYTLRRQRLITLVFSPLRRWLG